MIGILKEADNRIVCRVNDMIQNGISNVLVKTGDSDVIVILLGFMKHFMNVNMELNLLVEFKSSSGRKFTSLNDIYVRHGAMTCSAMPFLHCFTGADAASSFYKTSKKD